MSSEPDLGELVRSLTPEELASVPARLRRIVRDDPVADAWAVAKAERDEAIAAVTDPETGLYTDPEAAEAAIERWKARKAELLGAEA